jgi:hypothetical protein
MHEAPPLFGPATEILGCTNVPVRVVMFLTVENHACITSVESVVGDLFAVARPTDMLSAFDSAAPLELRTFCQPIRKLDFVSKV